jgi:hypothetical protein
MGKDVDSALSKAKAYLHFSAKLGFTVHFDGRNVPLACTSISKVTCKFVDALAASPYFAKPELQELQILSHSLERESLKRSPQSVLLVRQIAMWFAKSALRRSQLKEWLQSAPALFVSDLLRAQGFDDQEQNVAKSNNTSDFKSRLSSAVRATVCSSNSSTSTRPSRATVASSSLRSSLS